MVFDPDLNLLDYQISPAEIPDQTKWRIEGHCPFAGEKSKESRHICY